MPDKCAVFVGFMEFQYVLLPLVLLSGIQSYPRLTLLALCWTTVPCLLVVSGIHWSPIECSSHRLTLCIACLLYMAFMAFITCKRSQYIDVVLCLLASWNLTFSKQIQNCARLKMANMGCIQERMMAGKTLSKIGVAKCQYHKIALYGGWVGCGRNGSS